MKPVIGVTPLFDEIKNSIWMLPGYMEGIRKSGGVPIILPLEVTQEEFNTVYELCDGFLFTGGQDVNPTRYGEITLETCGICNEKRDEIEDKIFKRAYDEDKHILGICRGMHMINIELGGTLFQDIATQFSSKTMVKHVMKPPYDRFLHKVHMEKKSPLYELLKKDQIGVNSYHHQGIKTLGKDLDSMAYAPDGLIEAICSKTKRFIWGIQWHPEFLYTSDENSMKIFDAFVEAIQMDERSKR